MRDQTRRSVHSLLRGKFFKNMGHKGWIPPGLHLEKEAQTMYRTLSFPIPHSLGTKEMTIDCRSRIDTALKNNIAIEHNIQDLLGYN